MKNNTTESIKNDILERVNNDILSLTVDTSFEKKLCLDLLQSTKNFKPEDIFNCIYEFSKNKSKRILFSEIYNYISGLDDNQNSIFTTNIDTLLSYSEKQVDTKFDDTKKIMIKIYDHVHLAILQNDKVNKFFDKNIKDSKSGVEEEIKTLQSQSVTILGIFSSFVVSFIGGLVFSTSVFSNIGQQSIYKLILVVLLLGFVLISICFSLYWFIAKIINKCDASKLYNIYKYVIVIVFVLLIILFFFWEFGVMDSDNRICNNAHEYTTDVTDENCNNSTISDIK